ncbi:uncharacterized protein PITG_05122 [Phytophthora infestans T30-4]|uniref:Homeodomain-like domain-containing protein n=1 Tax=Phytophthora infestans (strain T30-4) TaxID=403677 RepID=D0N3L5_PHYIT|nr:uncharacterized protein PITG_05122 [Phytophthora infestans T30-4]EEY68969.1 conserved hypothetical protein [Phytophthora infestans T30-4]|eukprot:XP_002998823.1 conserved hypothetical protein [Phytophthora infestans T30-4]
MATGKIKVTKPMLYDDATVHRVLRAAHEGQDWRDVALKNDVKLRTAYRWINAAEDSGNWEALPRKPRGGKRHSKIQDEHVDYLVGLIDDNCYITLDARAIQMKDMPVGE